MTTVVAAPAAPKQRSLSITPAERAQRAQRVERVRAALEQRELAALVVFHPERIGYLTSFVFVSTERPMALVVPARGELGILIPQLEQEHVKKAPEIGDVQVYPEYPGEEHPMLHLREVLERKGLLGQSLGADTDGYGDVMG
jgi:Xaa-Pro aminopeptidase